MTLDAHAEPDADQVSTRPIAAGSNAPASSVYPFLGTFGVDIVQLHWHEPVDLDLPQPVVARMRGQVRMAQGR